MSEGDWQNGFATHDQPSHAPIERPHKVAVKFKNKQHQPLHCRVLQSMFSLEVSA